DGKFYTYEELFNKIKAKQTDKDDKLIILYTSDKESQHSYIEKAKNAGYEVLLLDSPIVSHIIQKLESTKDKISFARVDSDHIDNLINKDKKQVSKLDDEQKKNLEELVKSIVGEDRFVLKLEAMDSKENPFTITNPEFMRRMKEMQQTGGGGMFGAGNMPEMYNLVINTNSEIISLIVNTKTKKKQERLINQSLDLAKLSHGLLKGEELTNFISRSFEIIK
ncbi:molecular chaperone HtpG, partial [bacterium]|nr:molecular chaperone HtpG [bacterium]